MTDLPGDYTKALVGAVVETFENLAFMEAEFTPGKEMTPGVTLCCAGHIHGKGHALRFEGERAGTRYRLVSSDFLGFRPLRIAE